MGFQDRQYYHQPPSYRGGGGGMMRSFGFPPLTHMVKYLLIINGVVFVLQMSAPGKLESIFAATGQPWYVAIQVWRLLSFQFL